MDPITLDGVGFAFPGLQPLLRDVNVKVGEGEVVALVGPTGCGKSTLLHICAGVIPHFITGELTGEVHIFGTNTKETSLARIAADIGTVTQDPENQLFNLIVADEIAWGMENRGFERAEIRRGLDGALDFFRIPHLRDRITYDLSGGEKQRVVLSANYAPAPRLFILDDPTSQLDPIGAQQVLTGIRRSPRAVTRSWSWSRSWRRSGRWSTACSSSTTAPSSSTRRARSSTVTSTRSSRPTCRCRSWSSSGRGCASAGSRFPRCRQTPTGRRRCSTACASRRRRPTNRPCRPGSRRGWWSTTSATRTRRRGARRRSRRSGSRCLRVQCSASSARTGAARRRSPAASADI